jgi:hypothetical protein
MAKYIKLPDNSLFPVAEGEDYSAAMRAAYAKYPEAFGAASTQAAPKEGLMADVMGAGANLLNIGRTGIAALTGDTTQAAQAGVTRQEELQKRYKSGFDPEKITAPFEQGQYGTAAGEALKQVPSAVATVAPSVVQTAGLAAAGRLGGGALGSFFGPVGTVAGAQIGQYALPAVVGFIQALGGQAQEKLQTQKEAGEKPDVNALELAPYAAGSAALDLIGAKVAMPSFFKKMGGQKVAEETADAAAAAARSALIADARKVAGRGTFDTILRGTGGFALGELPTEVLQEVLDRAAVGKSLTDDEAIKSYRSTALMTVLAAPIGAGVGVTGRSGARTTVEQEDKRIAAKSAAEAAAAEEAAKTTPEALAQLDTQYREAAYQKTQLEAAVPEKPRKPKKDATPEDKQAYVAALKAHDEAKKVATQFEKEQFASVSAEYEKRKDAISAMQDAQLADIEQKTAAGQPTAAAPERNVVYEVPLPRLMDRYDQLRGELDAVETQLAAGPSLEEQTALSQQRQALVKQTDSYGQLLKDRGGVAMTAAEHTQAVKEADAEIARADAERKKLLTNGLFEEADTQATKIAELMQARNALAAQRGAFEEVQAGREQRGQTRDLFGEAPAPKTDIVDEQLRAQTLEEEKDQALYGRDSKKAAAQQAFSEAEIGPRGQLESAAPVSQDVLREEPAQIAAAEKRETGKLTETEAEAAKQRRLAYPDPEAALADAVKTANLRMREVQKTMPVQPAEGASEEERVAYNLAQTDLRRLQSEVYKTLQAVNEAKAARLRAETPKPETTEGKLDTSVWDIFSPHNVIATAIRNNDKRTLDMLARVEDAKKLAALENRYQEEQRIQRLLDERLGLGGAGISKQTGKPMKSVKLERADLFDEMYDQRAKAKFKNGTSQEYVLDADGNKVSLQEIYDKQGVAAVEMAVIMEKIRELRKKVETPQGNAKTSLYQKLIDLSAEHEALLDKQGTGLASKTMGEKVADVQAKLGKGEASAAREMDASEKYNLNRKIKAIEAQYNAVLGQVEPIRKQIDAIYATLYKQTPLETVEKERQAKKALLLPETGVRSMSKTARTQARIASGDVRKEAETSQKLRDLARDLGTEEASYKEFEKAQLDRYTKLKAKYGQYDPAVAAFQRNMAEELNTKAMELGKTTPEYKATLKEQIEVVKEALAGGKQELKSKRGTQTTRKVSLAKKEEATGSPESRAAGAERNRRKALSTQEQERLTKEANESDAAGREEERFARGVEVESPDLTPTQVASLQDNDLEAALQDIANDKGNSALNRAVALRLALLLDGTSSEIVPGLKDKDGREVLGMATSRMVSLNANGGVSQEVLLHEGTHAGTERVIQLYERDPSQLTEMQRVAVRELKALHAAAKADPRITSVNAKSSLSEFVAEVMSNKNLQDQLRKKPWKLSDAWAGFKSIVMRMLGVEKTDTMLGAAITAVDSLFIPPTLRIGGAAVKEEAVTQVLAQKDIAALESGSNSMREFAAQFGLEIKQKDRTPEDANRIGVQRLALMLKNPEDYVAPAEPEKLDYRTIMSDGKPYDANSPLHYVEADAITFATLKAQDDRFLREREAEKITEQRTQDLQSLIKDLLAHPEYTYVEQALVAKAASKYSVAADKNGRLKLVTIDTNNRHPVAVVGVKGAAAIIEELRTGKTLKDAFIIGLQRNADMYAKDNERKQGWQKFDQTVDSDTLATLYTAKEINDAFSQTGYTGDEFVNRDSLVETLIADGLLEDRRSQLKTLEGAAVALNAGAAGTPWCTGATVGTARSQLAAGDFYIHYTDGKPDVAVRMDGTDKIGEIRGNSPNQGINATQQKITTDFLNAKKFAGSDEYLSEFERRAQLIKIAKGETGVSTEDLLDSEVIEEDGSINEYRARKMLSFKKLDSYSRRPDPSDDVVSFFENKYLAAAKKAYENGAFVYSDITVDKDSKTISVDFAGKTYTSSVDKLKMTRELTISDYVRAGEHTPVVFPALTHVNRVSVFQGILVAPNMRAMGQVTFFNTSSDRQSKIVLPFNAAVKEVQGYGGTSHGVIEGPVEIGSVTLRRGDLGLMLTLPDTKYVTVDEGNKSVANEYATAAGRVVYDKVRAATPTPTVGEAPAHKNISDTRVRSIVDPYVQSMLRSITRVFGVDALVGNTSLEYSVEQYERAPEHYRRIISKAISGALEKENYSRAALDKMALLIKDVFEVKVAYPDAKLIAPERVGDFAPVQELVEAPEVPVYAPKTYGIKDEGKGVFSFKSRRTPGEFDADPEPSAVDTFLGNVMGLAGRMQFVDKFAAVSQAFKTGMNKGVLTDVEAGNAEFLMRFGEHRSQYATQILTNGPLSLVTTKKDGGIEHTYKSTKGANPLEMAEALSKGGFANDSEAEGLLTLVTSGERAKQVGWEKLNYSDPAKAKAKYERALAHLEANPKQKDAIKEAMAIYQKFNNGLMDFLVQVGELTAAKAAELKAITYVPFYRVNANGEVQLMVDKERPVRIGNIKDEPQLQQLVGDNKQIMPIFASMVQNTFMLTNLGLRNQTVKETAFTLRKIGIASRIGQGPGPASPDIVRFKKNGMDMHVVIDTDMYGIPAKYIVEGMEGIKTTIPAVVRLLGIPADILRKFVTRAPPYAIRQTIRDPLNAWLTTGTDAFPVLSSFKELGSMVAGRSETERTLMESGAVSSNVFTGDERDMSKVLREITSGKAGWTKLLAKADAFALQGDTATRAVIYKDSIAKGMSHQQALLRSVESMNFSRRGLSPSIQMLSTMIPFFNAQIQGLDVLYRAFKGDMSYNEQLKIREKLFQRGMLLAIGTMAYAAAMQDDEAYKRAKPEERYGNWFVYVPGVSEPLRIPIPFELGYLFKALPEAVYNLAAGDEKASDAVKGIGKLLGQSNPFALPQAVKPLTEVVLGSSFFGGDIESDREKNVLATDRYRDSSTEVSKLLGSVTGNVGLSPIKIDYLIRGYTGGLGLALVQLANPLLNTEAEAGVEKPSMKPSKIPFIGGLFQPVEGRGTLDSAYDKMLEIQQIKGTYNDLITKGKRGEAQAFAQQYSNQLALASTSGSVQKALGEMSKQERFIRNNPKLTTEQKDAALERLDKMKVAYARQFISLADRTTPR